MSMAPSRPPRVLLVGHDFVPHRSSGDKNYWLGLVTHLAPRLDWLGVASIVHGEPARRRFAAGPTSVDLYTMEPVYALTRLTADREPHPPKCAGSFKRQPASLVDQPLTLLRHRKRLRSIVARHEVEVIHFMDNVGVGAGLTRWQQRPATVTMSYLGFYTVNRLRSQYLSGCARLASGIAVANPMMATALRPRAMAGDRSRVIPWGSDPDPAVADDLTRNSARARLAEGHGLTGDQLIVWTGHTQQLGDAELHLAYDAVRAVTRSHPDVEAVFLLKPECEPNRYRHLATDRIRVCSSAEAPPFGDHLLGADVFLAPVARADTIVTPPLTWIEAMQAGTPIVSSDAPGVAEALGPLQRDLIAPQSRGPNGLVDILARAVTGDGLPDRAGIRAWASETYSLERSAEAYAEFWTTIRR